MFRFSLNRSWAFVLTLCLLTTCFFLFTAQSPSAANAGSGSCYMPADELPPTPSMGDPDVPMGPGDGKTGTFIVIRSGSSQVVSPTEARPVSDGAIRISVVMNRMRLFLLGLRSLYLRF
jgi:hypothetical protein